MFTVVPYVSRMVGKIIAPVPGYRRPPDLESQGALLIIPAEDDEEGNGGGSPSDDSDHSSSTRRNTFSGSDGIIEDKSVLERVSGEQAPLVEPMQLASQLETALARPCLQADEKPGEVSESSTATPSTSPNNTCTSAPNNANACNARAAAEPRGLPVVRQPTGAAGPWGVPLAPAPRYPITLVPKRTSSSALPVKCPEGLVEIDYNQLQFLHQIGEGGFGKVYYGLWRGQPVAIKVAALQGSEKAEVLQEFHREVTTMCSIPAHKNVLKLLGACTTWGNLALVTEYCSCGSLYHLLHSPNSAHLSWAEVLQICLGVAQGMAHLHAHKVLHRDLKSANLLLSDNGEVKIADFGLSKTLQDMQGAHTGGLGTYQWMAPEVLAHQRYSEKADIYSFGIVVWECIMRRLPYAGLTAVQAAVGVVNHGLRPEIPCYVPSQLASLIRSCWAAVPDQRPSFLQIASTVSSMLMNMESMVC